MEPKDFRWMDRTFLVVPSSPKIERHLWTSSPLLNSITTGTLPKIDLLTFLSNTFWLVRDLLPIWGCIKEHSLFQVKSLYVNKIDKRIFCLP